MGRKIVLQSSRPTISLFPSGLTRQIFVKVMLNSRAIKRRTLICDRGFRLKLIFQMTRNLEPVRGTVLTQANAPRSYVVSTPSGVVRRNRQHLSIVPQTGSGTQATPLIEPATETAADSHQRINARSQPVTANTSRRIATRLQTGTSIGPPAWL